jgi:hypothetical protein
MRPAESAKPQNARKFCRDLNESGYSSALRQEGMKQFLDDKTYCSGFGNFKRCKE